jgi:putative chitinase
MDAETLRRATGCNAAIAAQWADPLTFAMREHAIDTPARKAAFLAQVGHESGSFRYTRELWGPTPAQLRYEGLADLGNVQEGDGFRFRGRGPIQVTGRANYARLARILNVDLLNHPELLEDPFVGSRAAALWWNDHGCNRLADEGEFDKITCTINLGNSEADISHANGVDDRRARWARAKSVLGLVP